MERLSCLPKRPAAMFKEVAKGDRVLVCDQLKTPLGQKRAEDRFGEQLIGIVDKREST
jgi:hypothetical protein